METIIITIPRPGESPALIAVTATSCTGYIFLDSLNELMITWSN